MRVAAAVVLALTVSVLHTETVKLGEWGGPHARLTVRTDGAAVEFDCARGTIAGRIPLKDKGEFSVDGRYIAEHGGPVRKGDSPSGAPVTYRGRVQDETLTLEVVADDGTPLGSFALSLGA